MRHRFLALSFVLTALGASACAAQQPRENVRPGHHPNIAAAQQLSGDAYRKIVAAQQANEFDLGGHAARAKDLLEQANHELAEAARAANAH